MPTIPAIHLVGRLGQFHITPEIDATNWFTWHADSSAIENKNTHSSNLLLL